MTEDVKSQFKRALNELGALPLESITIKLWDELFRKFSDFTEELKIFLFYEEKNCQSFTLPEAAKWFKDNLQPGSKMRGGIFKEKTPPGKPLRLHLFFINNQRALIDGQHAHLFVNTLELEPEFLALFAGKSLLILE